MGNVLTYCEFDGASLRGSALHAVTAARQLAEKQGGQVVALLVGKGAKEAAAHAGKFAPQVIVVDDPGLEHFLAETYAPIVARIAKDKGVSGIVGTANNLGKDLLPRVAGILGTAMVSDVSSVEGPNTFKRPVHAGNATATVELAGEPVIVSARQSEFEPAAETGQEGQVEEAAAGSIDALGAEFVTVEVSRSDRPELTEAKTVVSGGRGMKNAENFKVLEELADVLGAAMGASRAATDAGYVPADWQVGQTGKVVAPDLYIAVAISGAIQHLAGMKGSKTIVAINKDAEAPIFQIADYGLVETWENAVPALTAALKNR